jgi:ketosteroid isomerase-like protein
LTLFRLMAVAVLMTFAAVALAQTDASATNSGSADEAVLMKMDSDFAKATQERRLEGWMEFMADDVVLRRGQNLVGREAVRTALTPEWANPKHKLNWAPVAAHMAAGGKVGYTWGKWDGEFPDEKGNVTRLTGTYITIWGKQKDGSWKVMWDGGGANPQ